MATVDMGFIQFYHPHVNSPSSQKARLAPLHAQTQIDRPIDSPTQAPSPCKRLNCTRDSSNEVGLGIATTFNGRNATESQLETSRDDADRYQGTGGNSRDHSNSDSDDDFLPTVPELLGTAQPTGPAVARPSKSEISRQTLAQSTLYPTSLPIARPGLGGESHDLPFVIEDDDFASAAPEDEIDGKPFSVDGDGSSVGRDSNLSKTPLTQDLAPELSQPASSSGRDWWYDLESGCYICEGLAPAPAPGEQGGSSTPHTTQNPHPPHHSPTIPSHQVNRHNDGRISRSTPEELVAPFMEKQHGVIEAASKDEDRERTHQGEKRQHHDELEETDSNHSYASNVDDQDPQPPKRRRLPAMKTPPRKHSPSKMHDAQSQVEHQDTLTPKSDEHLIRKSRGLSPLTASIPVAEYQEWTFKGFLKRTTIGREATYNLEFQLPPISKHLPLPIHSKLHGSRKTARSREIRASPRSSTASLQPTKRELWTKDEDTTVLSMKKDGCSWEEIHAALPHRFKQTIQVRYSTKLKK